MSAACMVSTLECRRWPTPARRPSSSSRATARTGCAHASSACAIRTRLRCSSSTTGPRTRPRSPPRHAPAARGSCARGAWAWRRRATRGPPTPAVRTSSSRMTTASPCRAGQRRSPRGWRQAPTSSRARLAPRGRSARSTPHGSSSRTSSWSGTAPAAASCPGSNFGARADALASLPFDARFDGVGAEDRDWWARVHRAQMHGRVRAGCRRRSRARPRARPVSPASR